MDASAAAQRQHAAPPPLPPELWNLVTIAIICGFVGWVMRLTQHFLTLVDVRFAVNSDAVLHLKDLGPSLSVLENASMWHFQQLLRTKLEISSAKMTSVRLPFEIPSSSLAVKRSLNASSSSSSSLQTGATAENATMHLSFAIKSTTKCVAQVFWGVKTEALLDICSGRVASRSTTTPPPTPSSSSRLSSPIPVLRSLSAQKKNLQQLPAFLSRVRRQNRRHRLDDDKFGDGDGEDGSDDRGSGRGLGLQQVLGAESFRSASPPERFDGAASAEHVYVAEMPSSCTCGPAEEIRSLLAEVEHDAGSPSAGQYPSQPHQQDEEPRYGAVVLVGSLDFFDCHDSELNANGSGSLLSKSSLVASSSNGSSSKSISRVHTDDVICQCVAIDFLPTPAKLEKFTPVVVKKLAFTRSSVYVQQEIFGTRDAAAAGECVICLEGELAAVLLPCRHFCVCRTCLEEIDRCPICRAKFTTYACYAERAGASTVAASDQQQQQLELVELKIV